MSVIDDRLLENLRRWRRDLHRRPELSFEEHETTAYIRRQLDEWDVPYSRPLPTGAVAHLRGRRPGPVVVVRCDIDGLPIQEETKCEFASMVPDRMHACGHDAHTAVALGLIALLTGLRDQIYGEVRVLFQPAEETLPSGAEALIKTGALDGARAVVGLHVLSDLDVGAISLRDGPIMASDDRFTVHVQGAGGHGAHPHQTVDALLIASTLVGELHTLLGRRISALQPAVLSIGTFHAGTAYNIIPGSADLSGTVRTFDEDVRVRIRDGILALSTHHARAHGAEAKVEYVYGTPPVVNHPPLVELLRPAAEAVVGPAHVLRRPPRMGGEDFAFYGRVAPSVFAHVGARNPAIGADFPHHHPRFSIDERCLEIGLGFLLEAVRRCSWTPDALASIPRAAPPA
jgi:amidohydrolase